MRPTKKARSDALTSFRTLGVSDATLSKILVAVKKNPAILESVLPSSVRSDISSGLSEQLCRASMVVKLPLIGGATFDWDVLSPQKALILTMDTNKQYRRLMIDSLQKYAQSSPSRAGSPIWNIIIYHDEITPGNVLRPDNKRKVTACYFSFREFQEHLTNENAWICFAVLRHTVIQTVTGGMAHVAWQLMKMFVDCERCFFSVGVILSLGRPLILRATISNILGDESALKQTFGIKGASGLKPCMLCKNICMRGSSLAEHDQTGYLQEISCSDCSKFDLASNEDVWTCADYLLAQQRQLRKVQMEDLQTAAGMNAIQNGLLADIQLRAHVRPISIFTYDAMHCLYSHGTASVELSHFLGRLAGIGIKFEQLRLFCKADWKMAKTMASKNPADVFSQNRENSTSDSFKGMASETLSVFPLLRHFAEMCIHPTGQLTAELVSFRAIHDVINLVQSLKKEGVTESKCSSLAVAVKKHFDAFVSCYGADSLKPKHHYCLHLADQARRDKQILDTFALERKHRGIKRYATECDNTAVLEKSITMRALDDHLKSSWEFDGLVGARAEYDDLASALNATVVHVAEKANFRTLTISENDVLIAGGEALIVLAACAADEKLLLVVRTCKFVKKEGYGDVWAPSSNVAVFSPDHGFHQVAYWTFRASGTLLTLRAC